MSRDVMSYPHKKCEWVIGSADNGVANQYVTCEIAQSYFARLASEDECCFFSQLARGSACGCDDNTQILALTWTQRVSGFLSLVGSLCVIVTTHRPPSSSSHRVTYHQLLRGISIFDCASSIAFMLGTTLTPTIHGRKQIHPLATPDSMPALCFVGTMHAGAFSVQTQKFLKVKQSGDTDNVERQTAGRCYTDRGDKSMRVDQFSVKTSRNPVKTATTRNRV